MSVKDNAGTITYNLHANGNPLTITAPGGVVTTISYDAVGRRTGISDPSHGQTTYTYSPTTGRLVKTTDANGNVVEMTYDKYGRMTQKKASSIGYDYAYNDTVNKVATITGSNNLSAKSYSYDSYGRLVSSKETALGTNWLQRDYSYQDGRLSAVKYTSNKGGLATENYVYTNEYLTEVKLNNETTIFKLNAENNQGVPTKVTTGPYVREYSFTGLGLPVSRKITGFSTTYQDFTYSFDEKTGNLLSRTNGLVNKTENFEYDDLDRMTKYGDTKMEYDELGNITRKGDLGDFSYETEGKPYVVSDIVLDDASTPVPTHELLFNRYGMPQQIKFPDRRSYSIGYDENSDKVGMYYYYGGQKRRSYYYLGGCYEAEVVGVSTTERLYLGGGYYDAVAVMVKKGSTSTVYYIGRDHLGSITHILKSDGTVQQELSYDAWGNLRNPSSYEVYALSAQPTLFLRRGFCGHEHLQEAGLINMNARIYDPMIGQFISPDNYVQAPDFLQNFNRYAYCMNNPLKYVDEDGNFWWIVGAAAIGGIINVAVHHKDIHGIGQALGYFGVGAAAGAVGAVTGGINLGVGGIAGGALSGLISGASSGLLLGSGNSVVANGNFNGALMAGFNGMWMGAVSGAVIGGAIGGVSAYLDGKNIWNGEALPKDAPTNQPSKAVMDAMEKQVPPEQISSRSVSPELAAKGVMENEQFPVGEGTYTVYGGYNESGEINYVGITKRLPEERFAEHLRSNTPRASLHFQPIEGVSGLSKTQARIIEQHLINTYGRIKTGGQLLNKINSISPRYWNKYGLRILIIKF